MQIAIGSKWGVLSHSTLLPKHHEDIQRCGLLTLLATFARVCVAIGVRSCLPWPSLQCGMEARALIALPKYAPGVLVR